MTDKYKLVKNDKNGSCMKCCFRTDDIDECDEPFDMECMPLDNINANDTKNYWILIGA